MSRIRARAKRSPSPIIGSFIVRKHALDFLKNESGATAIEYGLIAAGIAVAIIAIVNTLGGQLKDIFTSISTGLQQDN